MLIFFHVCFCSVSTLNHFCHGRTTETPLFHSPADVVPFWGEHSGVASPRLPQHPDLLPFHRSQIPPVTPGLFPNSPMLFPCTLLHVTLNTHLCKYPSTCKPGWLVYVLLYSPWSLAGYFSHSDFLCLHVNRSTLKLPCSAIQALCEP